MAVVVVALQCLAVLLHLLAAPALAGRRVEEGNVLQQSVHNIDVDDGGRYITQPEPLSYSEWAAFHITYSGDGNLTIANSALSWGKWYQYPDKDIEISGPDGWTVSNGQILIVAASGRDWSPSGTEGSFELWLGSSKLFSVNFDCPYVGSNTYTHDTYTTLFRLDTTTPPASGPIGDVPIDVSPI